MKRPHIFVWTGGHPVDPERDRHMADGIPAFPAPDPLRRAALIEYFWGEARFEIVASACSVRTAPWGSEPVTWLHCKAKQTAAMTPGEATTLMTVLIPAHYVTGIGPGPTFRIGHSGPSDDLGVFPPNQPAPAAALPLAEVERVLTDLLTPERN